MSESEPSQSEKVHAAAARLKRASAARTMSEGVYEGQFRDSFIALGENMRERERERERRYLRLCRPRS